MGISVIGKIKTSNQSSLRIYSEHFKEEVVWEADILNLPPLLPFL